MPAVNADPVADGICYHEEVAPDPSLHVLQPPPRRGAGADGDVRRTAYSQVSPRRDEAGTPWSLGRERIKCISLRALAHAPP